MREKQKEKSEREIHKARKKQKEVGKQKERDWLRGGEKKKERDKRATCMFIYFFLSLFLKPDSNDRWPNYYLIYII